jgi:O-acetylhomoserine/O-acetylserine sulfhydrylase-like pyridoxal-dependent enzyme
LEKPTNTVLEGELAILEGGESCMSMSSGIGAITSAMRTSY